MSAISLSHFIPTIVEGDKTDVQCFGHQRIEFIICFDLEECAEELGCANGLDFREIVAEWNRGAVE
jgi:hypothetical protein